MASKLGTLKTTKFKRFLKAYGWKYLRHNDGHEVWQKKGYNRPVIFQTRKREIPKTNIRSNLKTMGLTFDDLIKWLGK